MIVKFGNFHQITQENILIMTFRMILLKMKIEHKLLVHTPQQNGVADWKN